MQTIEHIQHYNRLNGKTISKEKLRAFQLAIKKDIDAGKITDRMPYGFELIKIERILQEAIGKMNGHPEVITLKPIVIKPVTLGKNNEVRKPQPTPDPAKEKRQDIPTRRKIELDKKARAGVTFKDLKGVAKQSTVDSRPLAVKVGKRKDFSSLGFTAADKASDKIEGLFRLPGEIGTYLGELQRYRGQIVIAGEFGSGKSELAKIIADAFASIGDNVGYVDWEHGGMKNKDTKASMDRNVSPKNKSRVHVSDEDFPMTFEALAKIANDFDTIVIDSGSKIEEQTNAWLDQLRIKFPDTFWIPLMQLKENGNVRGGSSAEFNAPTVIKTWAPDKGPGGWKTNYAEIIKNRGNTRGLFYSISKKKIIKPAQS